MLALVQNINHHGLFSDAKIQEMIASDIELVRKMTMRCREILETSLSGFVFTEPEPVAEAHVSEPEPEANPFSESEAVTVEFSAPVPAVVKAEEETTLETRPTMDSDVRRRYIVDNVYTRKPRGDNRIPSKVFHEGEIISFKINRKIYTIQYNKIRNNFSYNGKEYESMNKIVTEIIETNCPNRKTKQTNVWKLGKVLRDGSAVSIENLDIIA